MNVLVVYDSMYGNTAKVAAAIGDALRHEAAVRVLPVVEAGAETLAQADLLFVGSPTQRFRPLPAMTALLKALGRRRLDGVSVAAFDTRIVIADAHSAALSFFVRLFGQSAYAAHHIESALRRAGARPAAPNGGFLVAGTEGPLKDGELERAAAWARDAAGRARAVVGQARAAAGTVRAGRDPAPDAAAQGRRRANLN